MNNPISNIFRIICLIIHIHYCYMIYTIWGIKLKTFLFLTKINFFIDFFLFAHLVLNTIFKFDKRPEILVKKTQKKHTQYTSNEMSLIRAGLSFSFIGKIFIK